MDEITQRDWNHWWQFPRNVILFATFSAPVLIWRYQTTGVSDHFSLRPDILELVSNGLLFTVFFPVGPFWYTIGNFLVGLGTIWGFILGLRFYLQESKHKSMRNFAIAVGLMALFGLMASYFLPVLLVLQFQFLRSGIFMLYFSIFYLGYFLNEQFSAGLINKSGYIILCISYILLGTPLITILLWLLLSAFKSINLKPILSAPVVIVFLAFLIAFALQLNLWAPGFNINGPNSDWQDAQEWARENTPLESKFIAPPYFFGNYVTDWRVYSKRSLVVSIAEMMEILFNPGYLDDFRTRFNAVAPGAFE